jgi:hypothetical protein
MSIAAVIVSIILIGYALIKLTAPSTATTPALSTYCRVTGEKGKDDRGIYIPTARGARTRLWAFVPADQIALMTRGAIVQIGADNTITALVKPGD